MSSIIGNAGAAALALVLSMLVGVNTQQSATLVPAIISFGDSAFDVGNNDYYFHAIFKADFLPYGRDFINHQPTGRFCNGKLVADLTADTLGFTSYPPAYLSPQASGKNLLIGANFASAASGYFDGTAIKYHAISLSRQLEYYKEYQSKLKMVAGNSKASYILTEALYLVGFGTADFTQNYYINPHLQKMYTPNEFSSFLVGKFSSFIKDLYRLGARRIGVTSLPPLGCFPSTINLFRSNGCIERFNNDARGINKKLNLAAASLRKQLPKLKIVIFDIYKPFYDLATAPSEHGFLEARRGCCGTGTAGTTVLCNLKSVGKSCYNATGYVFWDGIHLSEAANKVLADSLLFEGIALFG